MGLASQEPHEIGRFLRFVPDPLRAQHHEAGDGGRGHCLELGNGQRADWLMQPISSFEPSAYRLRRFARGVRLPFVVRHDGQVLSQAGPGDLAAGGGAALVAGADQDLAAGGAACVSGVFAAQAG